MSDSATSDEFTAGVLDMAEALWPLLRSLPDGDAVRIVLRRRSGQWACHIGPVTGTGTDPATAIRVATERLEKRGR